MSHHGSPENFSGQGQIPVPGPRTHHYSQPEPKQLNEAKKANLLAQLNAIDDSPSKGVNYGRKLSNGGVYGEEKNLGELQRYSDNPDLLRSQFVRGRRAVMSNHFKILCLKECKKRPSCSSS